MKDLILGKNFVVTLHNDLVQAKFKKTYTINEQKILFTVLSNIEPPEFEKDEQGTRYIKNPVKELEPFRVPIKEFTEWLGIADPNYVAFKKTITSLMEKVIEIEQPDGSWKLFHWVIGADYIAKTGMAEITISPKLYPFLLNLKDNFTTIRLNALLNFKCKYSIRFYQLLKKWLFRGEWRIELDLLKELIGIPIISEKKGIKTFKLEQYGHFKLKVLTPVIVEINQFTELDVEIEEVKKGRKVTAINFIIKKKKLKASQEGQNKKTKPEESKKGSTPEKVYGYEILEKYNYRDKGVLDKETEKQVYLDDRERVQLILLNRKNEFKNCKADDNTYKLIENELVKVVNEPNFNICEETYFIFDYVDKAKGIEAPGPFILSKTKVLVERLLKGEKVTYKDVFKAYEDNRKRKEMLPDWWFNGEQSGRAVARSNKDEFIIDDSTMTTQTAYLIKIQLMLQKPEAELNEKFDMEEYYRLDKKYGIENLLEKKEEEKKRLAQLG